MMSCLMGQCEGDTRPRYSSMARQPAIQTHMPLITIDEGLGVDRIAVPGEFIEDVGKRSPKERQQAFRPAPRFRGGNGPQIIEILR